MVVVGYWVLLRCGGARGGGDGVAVIEIIGNFVGWDPAVLE